MFDETILLTTEDMAKVYRCKTAIAFFQKFTRDRRKPREQRRIPDPIAPPSQGQTLYWSPVRINALLAGEPIFKKAAR